MLFSSRQIAKSVLYYYNGRYSSSAPLTLTISPLGRGDFDWCRVMSCKGYSCDYELLTINNGYDKGVDKLVIRHQTYRQASDSRAVRTAGPVKLTLHHHQVRKVDLVIPVAISLTGILWSAVGPVKLALHHHQIGQVYLAVYIDISRTRASLTGITAFGIRGVGLSRAVKV